MGDGGNGDDFSQHRLLRFKVTAVREATMQIRVYIQL